MSAQALSPWAREIEAQLGRGGPSELRGFLRQETLRQVEAKGSPASQYDLYAVRRNPISGDEIFGPEPLHVGTYSEETLYGAAGSPLARFRAAIQDLRTRAERAASVDPESVDYGHHAALLWADMGRLKDFIGASPVISEIVAELRTARFQVLGKDTPSAVIQAVAAGLRLESP